MNTDCGCGRTSQGENISAQETDGHEEKLRNEKLRNIYSLSNVIRETPRRR